MYIIVHSGTRKERLKKRFSKLDGYVKQELQGPSPVKGAVYDFAEWSGSKTKSKELGTDKNGMRMKERDELKKDLKKKEIL